MDISERVRKLERKPAPAIIPRFGPLQGIRILQTAQIVAGPHIGTLCADFGAEVIHVENPGFGDIVRSVGPFIRNGDAQVSTTWADNGRNRLDMELDLHINEKPKAREIFLGLIKSSDIWVENMIWLEQRYGISDKLIREVNPKIVIVHVNTYGRPEFGGREDMWWQAGFDLMGQAYGGWSHLVGNSDGPPTLIVPFSADYITALTGCFGALMGYIHAQKTGKGIMVDASQFESVARILCENFCSYLNLHHVNGRGNATRSGANQPYGIFKATDGWIAMGSVGAAMWKKLMRALQDAVGINPDEYPIDEVGSSPEAINSPKGRELDRIITDWIGKHSSEEVEKLLLKYGVPCTKVYTSKDACEDRHWIDRDDFVECTDQSIKKDIKIFGVVPKITDVPGKIWRGAPALGQDTDMILKEILGYTTEEVEVLRGEKIICR